MTAAMAILRVVGADASNVGKSRSSFNTSIHAPVNATKDAWIQAPVVIGGTGGSGTRGVVESLQRMGIYVAPLDKRLKESCLNAEMDNHCMSNSLYLVPGSPDYLSWLRDLECRRAQFLGEPACLKLNYGARQYVNSIPMKNRYPHRWGWKHPKTSYQMMTLIAMYPELLFIHVVRNPLDMAATHYQHIFQRAGEFMAMHGGADRSEELMAKRCGQSVMLEEATLASKCELASTSDKAKCDHSKCKLSASDIQNMADCDKHRKRTARTICTEVAGSSTAAEGWRCMEVFHERTLVPMVDHICCLETAQLLTEVAKFQLCFSLHILCFVDAALVRNQRGLARVWNELHETLAEVPLLAWRG